MEETWRNVPAWRKLGDFCLWSWRKTGIHGGNMEIVTEARSEGRRLDVISRRDWRSVNNRASRRSWLQGSCSSTLGDATICMMIFRPGVPYSNDPGLVQVSGYYTPLWGSWEVTLLLPYVVVRVALLGRALSRLNI
jgi:hypothetical protein